MFSCSAQCITFTKPVHCYKVKVVCNVVWSAGLCTDSCLADKLRPRIISPESATVCRSRTMNGSLDWRFHSPVRSSYRYLHGYLGYTKCFVHSYTVDVVFTISQGWLQNHGTICQGLHDTTQCYGAVYRHFVIISNPYEGCRRYFQLLLIVLFRTLYLGDCVTD